MSYVMDNLLHPVAYKLLILKTYRYKLHPIRILKLLAFIVFLILFFITVITLFTPKKALPITFSNVPESLPILQGTHTFIHSAYYYPVSKSLGKHAVAIVTTMNKRTVPVITQYKVKIHGSHIKLRRTTEATLTTEHLLNDRCDYSQVLIQTNTLAGMTKLEIESEGVLVEIPFKLPKYSAPKPVVFCVSPQFAAEQFQTFLAQLHISKRYGAHLQLYIVSMIDSYYKLVKEYEKLGLVSIEPWLTIKFPETDGPYIEPNRNVELRNQAAAHTDCILKYKEAVSFIGVIDMDDILIPNNAESYYEEFEREYGGSFFISALQYEKADFNTIKVAELEEQSISAIVRNARRLPTKDQGKSFFRPERFNSSWSHYSRNSDNKPIYWTPQNTFSMRKKQIQLNGIFHLKNMQLTSLKNVREGAVPVNPGDNITQLISEQHLAEIDDEMKSILSMESIKSLSATLPKRDFYMPIIFNCYNQSFYHLRDTKTLMNYEICVNAFDCELPQLKEITCTHSDATYHSGPSMFPITYHWATDAYFTNEIGCYQ